MITLFAADGTILASERTKSHAASVRTRFAAWQRQCDALIQQHPTAVRATINTVKFDIVNGRSMWVD